MVGILRKDWKCLTYEAEPMSGLCTMFAANLIAKDMFEIIGEWLLDITKYVITVVVLTRLFDVLPNSWEATTLVAVVALVVAAFAVYMINKKNKNKSKNIHNKKK